MGRAPFLRHLICRLRERVRKGSAVERVVSARPGLKSSKRSDQISEPLHCITVYTLNCYTFGDNDS